ncbi:T9SS type A sorting domain-containing protein [Lentimicrobium sp. L6]|uniref:T9SS type A sorting domain-containing protein n=1 Tax=Lentimicrobium sp. L6 TaxID=2735916 RepID=UPI001551CB7C|nr:T9SS type A sorting domain-containing protein [Lentimicrobium sp. L6]NPD83617.1 T9SS type A sorting domain-containing protein [Lentimicrobium sp. L6]
MKKLVLLIFIIVISLPSFSQVSDYTIIRSDIISYFSEFVMDYKIYNPRKMVIEKEKMVENGKMFYSYPYAYQYDRNPNITIYPYTNIFGDSAFVDLQGNTTFYNCREKVITLNMYSRQSEEWIIYENDEDEAILIGKYQTPIYIEIMDGVWDSVVIISLKVEDFNGNILEESYYHNKEIIISKNYGITKHLQINELDGLSQHEINYPFHLIGIEKGDETHGFYNYYKDLIRGLEIGNEVHSEIEISNNKIVNRIKRVIQKEIGYSDIIYSFRICDYYPATDSNIQYETTESYPYLIELRESIPTLNQDETNSYWDFNYFFKIGWNQTNKKYFQYQIWETQNADTISGRIVWFFETMDNSGSATTPAGYHFIENIGKTCVFKGGFLMADKIKYYKTETEEWGTPFSHDCLNASGVDDKQLNRINIYPNPAEDRIEISFGESQMISASIINIQGQKVVERVFNSQASDLSFDISNLENGVYLVEIMSQNGTISQHKIIKK